MAELISRIAPTPSGFLHYGNAFSFLITWLFVRQAGGKLALRIDDNDKSRFRQEYLDDIFYSLDWLGLEYDIGPQGPDDFLSSYSQSKQAERYLSWLEPLKESNILYACSCSRKQIQQISKDGTYPGTCFNLGHAFNMPQVAWRLKIDEAAEVCIRDIGKGNVCEYPARVLGDIVVRKKDRMPAYQLVSLVEDLQLGANFIVRGDDLLSSSFLQVYLAEQLALYHPKEKENLKQFTKAQFLHHSLLLDEQGNKLSKSKGSISIKAQREQGQSPLAIYRQVAHFFGLPSPASLNELLQLFSDGFPEIEKKLRSDA